MAITQKQIPPKEAASLLNRKVIEERDTTYRIVSKNVSEYHFIVPFDLSEEERVEVGQIFSVKDRSLTFLARVLNIEHSSNYDGHWDTTMKGTQFYDSDQIFNRVIAQPLGCINKQKEFKKSRTLPTKFAPVARAENAEFEFLSQVMGDIEVGYLRNGSRLVEDIPVALHSEAMDHHMGVFATTGMGKSNFMKVFAASCMRLATRGESKFGLLIVDPHGEYLKGKDLIKGLVHLKRYRDGLACYSTDRKNASDPGVEELAISESEIFPEDIALLYEWSPAAKRCPGSHLPDLRFSKLAGGNPEPGGHGPHGAGRLQGQHGHGLDSKDQERAGEKSLHQEEVQPGQYPGQSGEGQGGPGRHTQDERPSPSSSCSPSSPAISWMSTKKDEQEGQERRKNCLITIEEAQRVLGAGSNTSRFESIAREGRKFGVGLCAITQQPKLIDKQLLSQFNTLVVMGLGDRNDRQQLEESAKQDLSSMDIEIQTLEKGEAVVSTLKIPFPVPARIHRYEDYLRRLDKEDKQEQLISRGGFKPFLE